MNILRPLNTEKETTRKSAKKSYSIILPQSIKGISNKNLRHTLLEKKPQTSKEHTKSCGLWKEYTIFYWSTCYERNCVTLELTSEGLL